MTEDNETNDAIEETEVCGLRLRRAREALSYPLSDIAKELHLDEPKVEALERNSFDALGAPVFAKGHLKKYAQLVKVDLDQVLLEYHQLTRADGLPPVVSNRKRPSVPKSPVPWILGFILLALIAAGYFGWQFWQNRAAEGPEPLPSAVPNSNAQAPESLTTNDTDTVDEPETTINESIAAALPEPEPSRAATTLAATSVPALPVEASSDVPTIALNLAFTGDCWTEVTDGDGDRLYFDLGRSGDVVSVNGTAPVSVLLGNAANVSVEVNGRDYTIAANQRNGDTARFTLYGS